MLRKQKPKLKLDRVEHGLVTPVPPADLQRVFEALRYLARSVLQENLTPLFSGEITHFNVTVASGTVSHFSIVMTSF